MRQGQRGAAWACETGTGRKLTRRTKPASKAPPDVESPCSIRTCTAPSAYASELPSSASITRMSSRSPPAARNSAVNAGSRRYLDSEKSVSLRAEGVVEGDESEAMAVAERMAGEGARLAGRRVRGKARQFGSAEGA